MLDISISLIAVMVSWMVAYVQTHQIAHSKYVQLFVYHLYLNNAVKKRKKRDCITSVRVENKEIG